MSYSAHKGSSEDDVSSSGIFKSPLWLFAACSRVFTTAALWCRLNKLLIVIVLWREMCITLILMPPGVVDALPSFANLTFCASGMSDCEE